MGLKFPNPHWHCLDPCLLVARHAYRLKPGSIIWVGPFMFVIPQRLLWVSQWEIPSVIVNSHPIYRQTMKTSRSLISIRHCPRFPSRAGDLSHYNHLQRAQDGVLGIRLVFHAVQHSPSLLKAPLNWREVSRSPTSALRTKLYLLPPPIAIRNRYTVPLQKAHN
ncbi:uncharacterized protein PV06_10690 [Exophiala oligosperma]|uniref:Uncharacterized protein n=1 Tax=Exophiala oligosperma TaxID=215243 RepID=A0A0D2A9Q2_9EURO|nr:uncharacterized protein PV06_10690 [Exophiala oligosperma]KIW37061.1 hypothetical protein PV06_10690 [Exophiala oligosperma]